LRVGIKGRKKVMANARRESMMELRDKDQDKDEEMEDTRELICIVLWPAKAPDQRID
jgi:hypothetical protein